MDTQRLIADLLADIEREHARVTTSDSPQPAAAAARAAYKTALGRLLAASDGYYNEHRVAAFERGRQYVDNQH